MENLIYTNHQYNIYRTRNGYIVHNTNKDFKSGHSHINNFNTAKVIIGLAIHKSIPRHLSEYLLVSLLRISEDEVYKDKINELIHK